MTKDFYADPNFYKRLPVGSQLLGDDLLILTVGETLSGKTALVNALEYNCVTAGTWPGSTVPRVAVDADILGRRVRVLDMNGAHGTNVSEIEELVRQEKGLNNPHVAILCAVNADALARSLPFIIELAELGAPLLLGLRDSENAKNKGVMLNLSVISNILDIPILTDIGDRVLKLEEIAEKALDAKISSFSVRYNSAIESSILEVGRELNVNTHRWLSIAAVQGLQVTIPDKAQIKATQQNISWRESGTDFSDTVDTTRLQIASGILREIDHHTGELSSFEKKMGILLGKPAVAIPVTIAVALVLFHLCFSLARPWMAWINSAAHILAGIVAGCQLQEIVQSVLNRCLIEGLGSFLAFMPLMFAFYFVLCFLEESGLIARFGHGISFICRLLGIADLAATPAGQSIACTVQGFNTVRILPSRSNQTRAALALPFIPCAGRLGVLACLSAVFFPGKAAVIIISIYLGSLILTAISLLLTKPLERRIKNEVKEEEVETPELPPCRIPSFKTLLTTAGILTWNFFLAAMGPVLICLAVIWCLVYFKKAEMIAGWFAWIFKPLGLGDWRMVCTLISGFFAKEAMLASAAMTYLVNDPCQAMDVAIAFKALWQATLTALNDTVQTIMGFFSWTALLSSSHDIHAKLANKMTAMIKSAPAMALLVFTAFSFPCLPSLISLIRSAGGKYALIQTAAQFVLAWLLALLISHAV